MTVHIPAARHGLVAAVLVVAAVLGASYLSRGTGGLPDSTRSPLPHATPGALPTAASLEPGTYVVANPHRGDDSDPSLGCPDSCSDYKSITFTLPDGWATLDGLVFKHLDQPNEVAFSICDPRRHLPRSVPLADERSRSRRLSPQPQRER